MTTTDGDGYSSSSRDKAQDIRVTREFMGLCAALGKSDLLARCLARSRYAGPIELLVSGRHLSGPAQQKRECARYQSPQSGGISP